jgi:hypothetical protein
VHLDAVRGASAENEFVDLVQAELLHVKFGEALDDWGSYDEGQRRALREAVDYLVRTDDEEDDLRSPIGFDDDAEVVEATLRRARG